MRIAIFEYEFAIIIRETRRAIMNVIEMIRLIEKRNIRLITRNNNLSHT